MKGILIPVLLCLAVGIVAANAAPSLIVTVLFNGNPVPGAIVQVTQSGVTHTYYTFDNGTVTINDLATGPCHIHAAKQIGGVWKEDDKDMTLIEGRNYATMNLHDPL